MTATKIKAPTKFTFKTTKPTGRMAWVNDPWCHIKLGKVEIGSIDWKAPHKVRLQVLKEDVNEGGNPNCLWKWITLKKESLSLDAAKEFVNTNFEVLTTKYKIYIKE